MINQSKRTRNTKRILSVKIIREVDTDPDTSYLGEYSNRATSEYSIDRAHSQDCASLQPIGEPANPELTAYECGCCNCVHPWNWSGDCRDDKNRFGDVEDFAKSVNTDPSKVELRSMEDRNLADSGEPAGDDYCDCGEHGDMRRHEYRYFNPSFNYVDKHGKLTDGNTPEEVRKYVRQDYERMESLNAGHWCYIGIRATAEIAVSSVGIAGGALIQTIRSGGLWGIESDSDKDHFAEVETEELAQLRVELKAIGFSTRAISTAFKNIEEVSE